MAASNECSEGSQVLVADGAGDRLGGHGGGAEQECGLIESDFVHEVHRRDANDRRGDALEGSLAHAECSRYLLEGQRIGQVPAYPQLECGHDGVRSTMPAPASRWPRSPRSAHRPRR